VEFLGKKAIVTILHCAIADKVAVIFKGHALHLTLRTIICFGFAFHYGLHAALRLLVDSLLQVNKLLKRKRQLASLSGR
jgi:hypothetical protein